MKKLLCIIMILCMIPVISLADDLASMSYDDLIALSRQITAEIMSRPEWKEVTVPAGTWVIGVDIPAGIYSVYSEDKYGSSMRIFENDREKNFISINGESPLGKIELTDGMSVYISRSVIFKPPVPLGF